MLKSFTKTFITQAPSKHTFLNKIVQLIDIFREYNNRGTQFRLKFVKL